MPSQHGAFAAFGRQEHNHNDSILAQHNGRRSAHATPRPAADLANAEGFIFRQAGESGFEVSQRAATRHRAPLVRCCDRLLTSFCGRVQHYFHELQNRKEKSKRKGEKKVDKTAVLEVQEKKRAAKAEAEAAKVEADLQAEEARLDAEIKALERAGVRVQLASLQFVQNCLRPTCTVPCRPIDRGCPFANRRRKRRRRLLLPVARRPRLKRRRRRKSGTGRRNLRRPKRPRRRPRSKPRRHGQRSRLRLHGLRRRSNLPSSETRCFSCVARRLFSLTELNLDAASKLMGIRRLGREAREKEDEKAAAKDEALFDMAGNCSWCDPQTPPLAVLSATAFLPHKHLSFVISWRTSDLTASRPHSEAARFARAFHSNVGAFVKSSYSCSSSSCSPSSSCSSCSSCSLIPYHPLNLLVSARSPRWIKILESKGAALAKS